MHKIAKQIRSQTHFSLITLLGLLLSTQGFALVPVPPKQNDTLAIVNDYSKGPFCGKFADKKGSDLTLEVRKVEGTQFLYVAYNLVGGGNLGLWNRTGMSWNDKDISDWTGLKAIKFLVYAEEAIDLGLSIKYGEKNYTAGLQIPGSGRWELVTVTREDLGNFPEDAGNVPGFNLAIKTEGGHVFAIASIKIEGVKQKSEPMALNSAPAKKRNWFKNIEIPSERSQKIYYVATNGYDSNPGTLEQPWRSPQKAADTMLPGDTVLIREGTYELSSPYSAPGQAGLAIRKSGAPDAWIRYRAYPGERPHIRSASWVTIGIQSVAYICIEGLEVTTKPFTTRFGNNSLGSGIGTGDAHHIIIRSNLAHDCGGGGIAGNDSDYILIEGNVVWGNAFYNPYQCSGISLCTAHDFDPLPGYHNVIRGNVCYSNENKVGTPEGFFTDGNGIIIDYSKNTLPEVPTTGRFLVENNLCFANGSRGIHIYKSVNVDVFNNTCYQNGQAKFLTGARVEICVGISDNVVIKNNIVVGDSRYTNIIMVDAKNVVVDYNLQWGGTVGVKGDNDLFEDPRFVKPSMGARYDFRLMPGSKASKAAAPDVVLPVEFLGERWGARKIEGLGCDVFLK